MGSVIQFVAVVGFILIVAACVIKPKRNKYVKRTEIGPKALYDHLTFDQLAALVDKDGKSGTQLKTSVGLLFDIPDQTQVDVLIGRVALPHIPRGSARAAMFDNRRIVICLSQDKQTMIHQALDADGRYTLHFVRGVDRTLEESYDILVEQARNVTAFPRRRAR